jgi:nicotinamidase/pyrazinamidase
MKTILIDVDTQHDFCDPRGALFVAGSERLAPVFQALVERAVSRGAPIVASVDSHAFDAWEFAGAPAAGPNGEQPGFPPHCVKGTAGWLKVAGTTAPRARFVPNVPVDARTLEALVTRHAPQQLLLEKEVYSLFANPNAEAVLAHLAGGGAQATRFVVFGVATDYCVRAAALGLVEWQARRSAAGVSGARGGEVWLVEDAIAAVDAAGGARAIAECAAAGVRRVSATDALAAL